MEVLVFPNRQQASMYVARTLMAKAKFGSPDNPFRLCLAFGRTMKDLFEILRREHNGCFRSTWFRHLDNYGSVDDNHPQSSIRTLREEVLDHLGLDFERQVRFLRLCDGMDIGEVVSEYERILADGVDHMIVGTNQKGHVAFHEPNDDPNWLRTGVHVERLSEITRRTNSPNGEVDGTPEFAITVGPRNVLDAKALTFMRFGADYAEAVRLGLEEPPSPRVPISLVQLHRNCTVVLDIEAASRLGNTAITRMEITT